MFKYIKIALVLSLYFYIVLYLKRYPAGFLFYLASILFFLAIVLSVKYKERDRVNIFLFIGFVNLAMIFMLHVHFISGALIFIFSILLLFFYCYFFISKNTKMED